MSQAVRRIWHRCPFGLAICNEGYSFPNAVKALAYFTDPFEKEMEVEEDIFPADRKSDPSFSPYPEYLPGDPLYIPDGVDEEE